jgi:hypothetical protein
VGPPPPPHPTPNPPQPTSKSCIVSPKGPHPGGLDTPPSNRKTSRRTTYTAILLWAALALASAFAIFVLPFSFPPRIPVAAEAYAAGQNNRIAAIAAGLLSLLAALGCLLWRCRHPHNPTVPEQTSLSWRWHAAGQATAAAFTLTLGAFMARTPDYYGEAAYFLAQLETGLRLHRVLYREFEFAYGPILYWWPALWIKALTPSFLSAPAAYVLSLTLMQMAGVALLFYVVDALPMARRLKAIAFATFVLGSLSPTLGLNYTLFRFLFPLAAMVLLSRQQRVWLASLVAAAGVALNFGVSPEMGLGFTAAALAYSLFRTVDSGRRWQWQWLGVGVAGLAGGAAFALLCAPDYFLTMRNLAHGGFNLIIAPEPRTLVLVIAVVALAPLAVTRWWRAGQKPGAETGMLLGIYCIALAMIPVALGRCDSIHAYFNGLAAFLLSFVAITPTRTPDRLQPWGKLWIASVITLAILNQRATIHLYSDDLRTLAPHAQTRAATDGIDVPALEAELGGEPLAMPENAPWAVKHALLDDHLLAPSYFNGMTAVWDQTAEEKKIVFIRQARFALLWQGGIADPPAHGWDSVTAQRWAALGLHYHQIQIPYRPGLLLEHEFQTNWEVAGIFGKYILRRRVR